MGHRGLDLSQFVGTAGYNSTGVLNSLKTI
jgi:hypothetical protein